MIREPPPFFHRGPSPLARLTFFLLFAIGLMIADDPLTCVARGSGKALEKMERLATIFTND